MSRISVLGKASPHQRAAEPRNAAQRRCARGDREFAQHFLAMVQRLTASLPFAIRRRPSERRYGASTSSTGSEPVHEFRLDTDRPFELIICAQAVGAQ
jgi:hypothetical protein